MGAVISEPDANQQWAGATLPRVSRTFALNIGLLRGTLRDAVRTAYLLCRAADAIEDSWPGSPLDVRERFRFFALALSGDSAAALALASDARAVAGPRADLLLVAELPRVLALHDSAPGPVRGIVADGVNVLASGMSRYAARAAERGDGVPYLDDEAELHDYCWVVAGCIGVMLTRLFETLEASPLDPPDARRLALAPVVGEALQLTNILLDWPRDLRRGRCYLPATWLAEADLTPAALVDHERPGTRALAARLEQLARAALDQVPDYLARIPSRHVRYRLFCLLPAVWAVGSLERANRDAHFPWGVRRPRLARGDVWLGALRSLAAVHDAVRLRRLLSPASR